MKKEQCFDKLSKMELFEIIMRYPATAFKILTAGQWAQFQRDGQFHGAPVDITDGYIHMSTADQLVETLATHFVEQNNLTIAEIDLSAFGDELKWEVSRGGALFPHLYVPLPMHAVIGSAPA